MDTDVLLSPCPACGEAPLAKGDQGYQCSVCGLRVKRKKKILDLKSKVDQYVVQHIGNNFSLVKTSLVGHLFFLSDLEKFHESVYSDQILADFAEGNYEALNMPGSTLAQILLEQLRETCYIQIKGIRRAHGPTLEGENSRFPRGKVPTGELRWQDKGNLFLTNIRLVFPSNTFTFIRMDRKVIGLKAYENGLALQRKGEAFATYFVGFQAHQSVLAAAYIYGKIPQLRREKGVAKKRE